LKKKLEISLKARSKLFETVSLKIASIQWNMTTRSYKPQRPLFFLKLKIMKFIVKF